HEYLLLTNQDCAGWPSRCNGLSRARLPFLHPVTRCCRPTDAGHEQAGPRGRELRSLLPGASLARRTTVPPTARLARDLGCACSISAGSFFRCCRSIPARPLSTPARSHWMSPSMLPPFRFVRRPKDEPSTTAVDREQPLFETKS